MIEKYPTALLIKDRWGDIPLTYALYAEASIEVINFLFKTHRQMWGDMPFDFAHIIETVAAKITSAEYVRNVIRAQRAHFPSLEIDWQSLYWEDITIDMYRVLVEASVSLRYICMSEEHRSIIDARVLDIKHGNVDEERYFVEIRDLVRNYARLHHEHLLDATTILELALWKAIYLHSRDCNQGLTRAECRTDAGRCAEVVIKLVLAFL
jgi:hypothetical protein